MPTVVIDGPEKAGKTTLIQQVGQAWCRVMGVGSIARRRPWGPVPSDLVYGVALQSDVTAKDNELIIWDRSWASESVYSLLLSRPDRRLAADPWLGEWLYGRAAQTLGARVMVSCDPEVRAAARDDTDLPVDPWLEGFTFDDHARRFGWHQVTLQRSAEQDKVEAERIVQLVMNSCFNSVALPPIYCGVVGADVIVCGERRNEDSTFPGAWLPLTTPLTTQLGRALGDRAFQLGWCNAHDCPPAVARSARTLVALGERAGTWARFQVGHPNVVELPHPAWLYRFGAAAERIPEVEAQLRALVQ